MYRAIFKVSIFSETTDIALMKPCSNAVKPLNNAFQPGFISPMSILFEILQSSYIAV